MKKVAFIFVGLLAMIMLAGCGGEGSSSASTSQNDDPGTSVEVVSGVGTEEASVTTPVVPEKDAFANLSVGTPPGLPE